MRQPVTTASWIRNTAAKGLGFRWGHGKNFSSPTWLPKGRAHLCYPKALSMEQWMVARTDSHWKSSGHHAMSLVTQSKMCPYQLVSLAKLFWWVIVVMSLKGSIFTGPVHQEVSHREAKCLFCQINKRALWSRHRNHAGYLNLKLWFCCMCVCMRVGSRWLSTSKECPR